MKLILDILNLTVNKNYLKFFIIICMVIINSFIETLGIALIYPIINFLLVEDFSEKLKVLNLSFFLYKNNNEIFELFLIFIILVGILKVISQIFLTKTLAKFVNFNEAKLSIDLLRNYLQFPYLKILEKNTSNIINELTSITGRFIGQILTPLINMFSDFFILFIVSIFLIYLDYKIYFICVFFLTFFFTIYALIVKKKIINYGKELNVLEAKKINIIQQIFKSIKNFKLSGNQIIFFNNYANFSNRRAKNAASYMTLLELPRLFLEFFIVLGFSITLLYLNKLEYSNYEIVSFIGVYAACFFRLIPVLNRFAFNYQEFKFGKNSLDQIMEIKKNFNLDIQKISIEHNFQKKELPMHKIIFKDVSFSYIPDQLILNEINFSIASGERIGLIGKTGSGKTTLVDILCGLIKPTKGEVLYNNKNVYNNFDILRHSIGYVPQVVFLNNDSLVNNIAFGIEKDDININKVSEILKILDLETFVDSLPNKMNTIIGENGFSLSGGQRQRIGIARSIYHDPSVLIFDEATNSLDNETERFIFKNLSGYLKKTLIIMITHKLETLKFCSRVLKVKDGEVFDNSKY